jgi:hypothetical protein
MSRRIALSLILLGAAPATAAGPIAEVVCAPRGDLVERLTRLHGAAVAATGLRDTNTVMEIWTAPSGDWTLVQTYTDGLACILAMGAAWDMPRASATRDAG